MAVPSFRSHSPFCHGSTDSWPEESFSPPRSRGLRWAWGAGPRPEREFEAEFDETIDKMLKSALRFDAGKVDDGDVARASGPPDE
jgi:hypothetical protein